MSFFKTLRDLAGIKLNKHKKDPKQQNKLCKAFF